MKDLLFAAVNIQTGRGIEEKRRRDANVLSFAEDYRGEEWESCSDLGPSYK